MEDLFYGYNSCDALQIIDGVKSKNKKWSWWKKLWYKIRISKSCGFGQF